MKIAIYGKGGIGKSTISSNISVALSLLDKKILQIGCDPKQDSTRLLLRGNRIPSVLEYIKTKEISQYKLEELIHLGVNNIHCIEAGGPEPGVGCAGRGILSTFELIETLGLNYEDYDITIYDVLGDVVCGGFAVPIRKEYADRIYIVTSGEFMSIYAANNILKGINNYGVEQPRVGGLIYNERGLEDEDDRIEKFSRAVGIPIISKIPRSELFARSELEQKTIVEKYPNSYESELFFNLAKNIINNNKSYIAKSLDIELLEKNILGLEKYKKPIRKLKDKKIKKDNTEKKDGLSNIYSKNIINKEPLHGCAYSGAAGVTTQVKESATVSHGPNSCAHITYQNISSIARRTLMERGITLPIQTSPPFYSTEMDENVMIFGGVENLIKRVKEIKINKPKVIFILTTCPSGIIGDNVEEALKLEDKFTKIIPIKTDGNISGDYLQGIFLAYKSILLNVIDKNIKPRKNFINIIGEKPIASTTEYNYKFIKDILSKLGLQVNTRFICNSSYGNIKNFKRGELNILAYDDYMGRHIKEMLLSRFKDLKFFKYAFPVGFSKTKDWIIELSKLYNKEDISKQIIADYKNIYLEEVKKHREKLKGKKLMLIVYNQDIDWFLETIIDLNIDIIFIGVLDHSQEDIFYTNYSKYISNINLSYNKENLYKDIDRFKPDILLTNYASINVIKNIYTDTIPLSPSVGFFSALNIIKKWTEHFDGNLVEGWKKDEDIFRKYYSR